MNDCIRTYRITIEGIGSQPIASITQELFENIKSASRNLKEALAVEQKYEILLKNYLDFEKEILDRIATGIVRGFPSYLELYEHLLSFDVRLVNFLAAAGLYAEQAPRHVKRCIGIDGRDRAKAIFSSEYDTNASYRFMCALRNSVIHSDLPVHGARIGGTWIDLDGVRYREHTISLRSEKVNLKAGGKFKRAVLNEMPDSVDLSTSARSFMSSLSTAHIGIRSLIKDAAEASRSLILKAVDDFIGSANAEGVEPQRVGIRAQEVIGDKVTISIPLLLAWDDVRLKLIERNGRLLHLQRSHATGRSSDKDALRGQPDAP